MIVVHFLTLEDRLQKVVEDINASLWDDANEMVKFDVASLSAYLRRQDNIFVTCYEKQPEGEELLGIASARLAIKPYDQEYWLYIDEVDVCADQRKKGAGKAMMRKLIDYSREVGCTEVWLGTEPDNVAANALYTSLEPDEVDQFNGYTYSIKENVS